MGSSILTRSRAVASLGLLLAAGGCATTGGGNAGDMDNEKSASSGGQRIEDMFAGRFPGVEVFRIPTGGIRLRIRGASTILGNSEPLYIIDGTKVQSGTGGLLFIDPGDIQKIEVLKDIGSTSLYGSEGVNGVILITTKRGR